MSDPQEVRGFAIECDPTGKIRAVLRDEFGLFSETKVGDPWTLVVDREGAPKAFNLQSDVVQERALCDWDFTFLFQGNYLPFSVSAITVTTGFIVFGVRTVADKMSYFWRIASIVSIPIDEIELFSTLLYRTMMIKNNRDEPLYNDLMRLNNEAFNLQRDLAKKNAQWESLVEEKGRLISELQTASEQIKTLKGIVPICANCKKIRDDEGFWEQVEVYITKNSDALFSHSICPDCMAKLYPEFPEG